MNEILDEPREETIDERDEQMKRQGTKLTRQIGAALNLIDQDMMKVGLRSDGHNGASQE
jgi:hypothetical protein